jgi:putative peptidoglycan lipid II flippase
VNPPLEENTADRHSNADAAFSAESKSTSKGTTERILSAAVAIAVAHTAAKILGLVQARAIGHYFGFGPVNDAFVLAFEGVIYTLYLVGEESLGPAFLPVFMSAKEKDSEESAWRFTSALANLQLLILAAATVLLMVFPNNAIELLSRFSDHGRNADVERAQLAVHFLGAMAPSLIGMSLGSLTYMILNGYKNFFWPAFADALMKVALLVGLVIGYKAGATADALIAGVLAAGFMKIAVHLLALRGKLRHYRPVLSLYDPHLRSFLVLVTPLLIGIVFAKVRDYYNYYYIISSLEEGMLSVNSYGRKIYSAIGWLVPYPLSIALFPFFCEMVARDDRQALGDFLTRASRMLLLLFLPMTIVIIVLSVPLAQALFQTGKVSAADAAVAGRVNMYYSAVLPFFALEYIYMQAYFSTHRMTMVTVIGIVFSMLSMAISAVGVIVYKLSGTDAVIIVALGYTVSRALKTMVLALMLKSQGLPLLPAKETFSFVLRMIVLTAAIGAVTFGILKVIEQALPTETIEQTVQITGISMEGKPSQAVSGTRAILRAAPKLVAPALAAIAVFIIGCKILRLHELNEVISFTKTKLSRRRKAA